MWNFKSYIKSEVESLAKANAVTLTADRIEAIFDWNEIGDPYTDLEGIITWNLDQNISHA
jgi:hypothetical protein